MYFERNNFIITKYKRTKLTALFSLCQNHTARNKCLVYRTTVLDPEVVTLGNVSESDRVLTETLPVVLQLFSVNRNCKTVRNHSATSCPFVGQVKLVTKDKTCCARRLAEHEINYMP